MRFKLATVSRGQVRLGTSPIVRALVDFSLISHKVFIRSFCKSQPPHRSVNLPFIVAYMRAGNSVGNSVGKSDVLRTSDVG